MKKNSNRVLNVFEQFCYKYRFVLAVVYLIACASIPFLGLSRVQMRLLTMIGLYSMLGMGLNVLTGYTGLVSLGHAGFYGIGAYVCALLQLLAVSVFCMALLSAAWLLVLLSALLLSISAVMSVTRWHS